MTGDRRGFTLIELLVVTVLGSIVLLAGYNVLIANQRTYTAQNAVIQNQQNARMAVEVLFNELREVSPSGGDILAMSADSVRVRLMRKFSVVCDWDFSGGQPEIFVLNLPGRRFETNDSVFIYADNYENDIDDDVWIAAQVTQVDTTQACPQNGEAASRLRFNLQNLLFAADTIGLGAPVRSYDTYTFGSTTFFGDTYLGRRQGLLGFMMPVVGPIRSTNGVLFEYRDALGNTTATASDVRQIVVTVRTGEGVINPLNQEVTDSITAWVYTRN
jgi:prepilin-type N-terminal cleavage/methylation domain-containing protein